MKQGLSVLKVSVVVALILISCSAVQAQLLCNPAAKADPGFWEFGGLLNLGKVEYDADDSSGGEVERTILGGYAVRGISDSADFFGGIAYIASAEVDAIGADSDGDGFMAGVGMRVRIDTVSTMNLNAYGQIHHISETYGSYQYSSIRIVNGRLVSASTSSEDYEGSITEVLLGICGKYEMEQINPYACLEVVPVSEGELEGGSESVDVERDSLVTVRLGAEMAVAEGFLRGEIGLIGEQTFTIAFGKQF